MVSSLETLRFPDKSRLSTKFLRFFFLKQNFLPHHWNPFTSLILPPLMSPAYSPCWSYRRFRWGDNSIKITTPVLSKGLFISIYLDAGRSGAFSTLCEWQLTLLPFLEVFSSIIFMSLLFSLFNAKTTTEIILSQKPFHWCNWCEKLLSSAVP